MLVLPASRSRLVGHFVQLTNVAPEYAPGGTHLTAATVLNRRGLDDPALFAEAKREIAECYPAACDLTPVAAINVPYGQRQQPAGFLCGVTPPPAGTFLDNVWLAGGQTTACSIQTTMVSGERTAAFLAARA